MICFGVPKSCVQARFPDYVNRLNVFYSNEITGFVLQF